jgi:hypothetical protein
MRLLQLWGLGNVGRGGVVHFPIALEASAIPTRTVVFSPFKSVSFFLNFLQGITILFLLVHSAFFLDRGESLNNGILVNEGLVVSR